jgi:hypothetical protein
MADLTLRNFLKELGLRLSAAAVVVGTFFALGYANRTDFLGLSTLLTNRLVFFAVAFLIVGVASLCWIAFRRYST